MVNVCLQSALHVHSTPLMELIPSGFRIKAYILNSNPWEVMGDGEGPKAERKAPLLGRIYTYIKSAWTGVTFSLDSEWEEGDWPSARARPDSLEALVRATRFSRAELKRIYRSFKAHCPSGLVTEDSFRSIYSQFFPQGAHTHAYVHYLFHNLDQANKGTLSFQDMACGLSILCRGSTEERLRWVFKLYDLNGDGRVSRDEMAEVVSAVYGLLGHGPHPPHQYLNARLDTIFQKMDRNKDGVVTLDEFLESCLEDASITNSLAAFDSII